MKDTSIEKYMEWLKFICLFIGFVCSYLTWVGIDGVSNEMFIYFPKILPATILGMFVLALPKMTTVDKILSAIGLVLVAIPVYFFSDNQAYRNFYWQIPLALTFIFLAGKISYNETFRTILLYFSGGYVAVMLVKMLMVTFEIGNIVLWTNQNLIAGPTFFASMLVVILIEKMDVDYSLILQGLVSLAAVTVFYLCLSWTPLISYIAFLAVCLFFKFIPILRSLVKKKIFWMILFAAMFIIIPIFLYLFVVFEGFGIPLSRREIWEQFFDFWGSDTTYLLTGLRGSFVSTIKNFGTHNAYLDILGCYGIIGYSLFFGGIYFLTFRHRQKNYSMNQVLCLTAFLFTCLHAMMENYLNTTQWVPMIFIYLALFISQSEEASELEELELDDEVDEDEDEEDENEAEESTASNEAAELAETATEEEQPSEV
ncbi:EpaQ family protein [Enterococcus sp. BWR-S5]|uniref:EpaQ family protein n=1 Tax=Enterococcus sp. BWR-S5 TaxID=2787714 RepID=UPI001924508E|nr:EpaQ family protein [Enterococcus sp. BWR-S5]MBL1225223.1 EpaQ family protein [Enterococcus sp. BWR-S5]